MKYLIHACEQRMWYVKDFLIPSMVDQGIDISRIRVFNDADVLGNLKAYMASLEMFGPEDDYWHISDDVCIAPDFAEKTEKLAGTEKVICAFACKICNNASAGIVRPIDMWYSFPGIYIDKYLAMDFLIWLKNRAPMILPDCFWLKKGKGDDALFKNFLIYNYPVLRVLNYAPNLVNHIDYMLGGSITNTQRDKSKDTTAVFWNHPEILEDLERRIGYVKD